MIININETFRITQDRANYIIQEKVVVKDKDVWTPKYYYSNLQSAMRMAFTLDTSGRKIVNLDELESHIQKELAKFISKITITKEMI